ncbi:MAG TPA: TIGR03790 family protein [Tepidisphaeraceae bacterium]|jgi:uncharacterized protein (TIGR03790 family)|nr:TIGR03790 family protein [Tepidisphaeraceae bacterium]
MKTPHRIHLSRIFLYLIACLVFFSSIASALEPDQIVLIVNSKAPEGRRLADFYAEQRHLPAGRILELSLEAGNPADPWRDMSAADFDEKVIPVVRDFLKKNGLDRKVTCLVSFWGVPLRVGPRSLDAAGKKELADLKAELAQARGKIEEQVKMIEALAGSIDPDFHSTAATDLDSLALRAEVAVKSIVNHAMKIDDLKKREDVYEEMMTVVRNLGGQPAAADKLMQPDFVDIAPKKPTAEEIVNARQRVADLQKQVNDNLSGPQDAQRRAALRELFRTELGYLNSARIIVAQSRSLDTAESESAFDSELSLLWWPPYPRARWALNPLNFHYAGRMALPSHTLMVMRLDGPSEQSVHDLIAASIKVENEGLRGEVVLDARGKSPTEPYGQYDQTIRNLADLLQTRTKLKVVLDNKESLMKADSEKDIAVYCGWYSLRNYVAPGEFSQGAVGFHIASFEMMSLHDSKERGWCYNLLKAGVVGTLGPVYEPYLQSFPPADEFFPLLMTGKIPLADVYWKTTPWTSWMQCCVGDPLYTPFKMNPPLSVSDLPEALKSLVQ